MNGRSRCAGKNAKSGEPCRMFADGGVFCAQHDPARADERRARAAQLGKRSQKVKAEARRGDKAAISGPLATLEECQEALERIFAFVESASGGKIEKANAAVKIVTAAATLLSSRVDLKVERELGRALDMLEARLSPAVYQEVVGILAEKSWNAMDRMPSTPNSEVS
jgi:hypothetical protein